MVEIVMYSTDYSDGILREIPYVGYFDGRGLHHLSRLRDPDHRMALITLYPVAPDVLDYHFRDLLGMDSDQERSARKRLTLLRPGVDVDGSLADRVLADHGVMARLHDLVSVEPDRVGLTVFAAATSVEELGAKLDVLPSERPYSQSWHWGSKAGSRTAFRGAGVAMPRGGVDVLWTADEVVRGAIELARLDPPPERLVVKLNSPSWGDGIGNAVINTKALLETGVLKSSVEVLLQSWENFEQEIPREGAIVEEFLSAVVCSPSGQGHIDEKGDVRATSSHEQIITSGQYLGCYFPARVEFRDQINDTVLKIGRFLGSHGLRGSFGVDFVGLADGKLFAVEVNARKVATSHVVSYVESVTGTRVGSDGTLNVAGEQLCYVHRRLIGPELRGLSSGDAISALRDSGLLYDWGTRRGVLLHILGALQACGYVEATCVNTDPATATECLREAEVILRVRASAALSEAR